MSDTASFAIDASFEALIPPLSPDERMALERAILADGCREPVTIWQEKNVLLDGHNRFAICSAHGIYFDVRTVSLPDRDAAEEWILLNQIGRRNVTSDALLADDVGDTLPAAE